MHDTHTSTLTHGVFFDSQYISGRRTCLALLPSGAAAAEWRRHRAKDTSNRVDKYAVEELPEPVVINVTTVDQPQYRIEVVK